KIILSGTDPDLPDDFHNSFARYVNFQPMGGGGNGVLRSCWDSIMGRPVAMKTLSPKLACEKDYRRRFLREARVTAQLQHPNTVPVYDIGLDDQRCLYFTMKRIAGDDLYHISQRLKAGDENAMAEYPLERILDVLIQTSQALAYAHSHGVIHRDVKPENVWVGRFGEVVLLDWGVAKVWGQADDTSEQAHRLVGASEELLQTLTRSGQRPGTPLYMSPEQVLGNRHVDERTDVYSLGVMLYELLTFSEPFRGVNVRATFDQIINDEVVPPSARNSGQIFPQFLEQICLKSLQKDPGNRFQSMLELIAALHQCQRELVDSYED
ncbi:MAG: serine/threonine-protein kinase, partial [Planctomycetaceae bacterium]